LAGIGTPREPWRVEGSANYSRKAFSRQETGFAQPPRLLRSHPSLKRRGKRSTLARRVPALSRKEGNGRKPAGFLLFVSFRLCFPRKPAGFPLFDSSRFFVRGRAKKTTPALAGVVRDVLVVRSLRSAGRILPAPPCVVTLHRKGPTTRENQRRG
jgi:hypothetical protein